MLSPAIWQATTRSPSGLLPVPATDPEGQKTNWYSNYHRVEDGWGESAKRGRVGWAGTGEIEHLDEVDRQGR